MMNTLNVRICNLLAPCALILFALTLSACGGSSSGSSPTGPSDTDAVKQEQPLLYFAAPTQIMDFGEVPAANPLLGGAGDGAVSFTSSHPDIIDVNRQTGRLDIKTTGQSIITAVKAADANNFSAEASYTLIVNQAEQAPLVFASDALVQYIDETPTSNPVSGGSGPESTTFVSSDTNVVTVDSVSGALTFVDEGSATITATRGANDRYEAISASYTVTVLKYPQEPLVFTLDSITHYIDEAPTSNPVSGGSTGATIQFESSDPGIVSVHTTTGSIQLLDDGTVAVRAFLPATDYYSEVSATYQVTVLKYEQDPLLFSLDSIDGALDFPADANDVSGGSGTGAITYSSENTDIASVDITSGLVIPQSVGTTTITATKAEDALYMASADSYELNAREIVGGLKLLLGSEDTVYQWASQLESISAIRSRFETCDPSTLGGCINFQQYPTDSATETPIVDDYPSLTQSAYFRFSSSRYQSDPTQLAPVAVPFATTSGNTLVPWSDQLWSFGGENDSGMPSDSIWLNSDGTLWTQSTLALPDALSHLQAAEFNSMLLIGGGRNDEGYQHSVWALGDDEWQEVFTPELSADISSYLVTMNDSLWLISSEGVWQSDDAISWSLSSAAPAFGSRNDFAVFTHEGALYVIGGYALDGSDTMLNDIWSSTDGSDWQQVSAQADFSPVAKAQVLSIDGTLYLIGGESGDLSPHLYVSSDGSSWTDLGTTDLFDMTLASAVIHDSWIVISSPASEYIWLSEDGLIWRTPANSQLNWSEN